MILGIDFGASTTDAVLLQGKRVVKRAFSEKPIAAAGELDSFLREKNFHSFGVELVAVTGGRSAFFKGKILGLLPVYVNEINAIGFGAAFLSKAKRCLAVSMGSGTCIVLFAGGKCRHVIGSGLGGGAILGLSRLLLHEENVQKLYGLALEGNLRKIDLSVKDVLAQGIGSLPSNATASNFMKANAGNRSRGDLAAGVQNMVAESIAVLAVAAAKSVGCGKIVFLGKCAWFPFVKRRLRLAARLFGQNFSFPGRGGFGSAIGAACFLGIMSKSK